MRIFTIIAVLALTATVGQAQTLTDRIQVAAQKACSAERASGGLPASHYEAIYQHCVRRLSNEAMTRVQEARAKAPAKLAGN